MADPRPDRVYVLCDAAGRRYIGLSEDVQHRLDPHNAGLSRWTRSRGPWTLEWTSAPLSLTEARKLEYLLKRRTVFVFALRPTQGWGTLTAR